MSGFNVALHIKVFPTTHCDIQFTSYDITVTACVCISCSVTVLSVPDIPVDSTAPSAQRCIDEQVSGMERYFREKKSDCIGEHVGQH